jgi:hypothetical protein
MNPESAGTKDGTDPEQRAPATDAVTGVLVLERGGLVMLSVVAVG